MFKRIPKAGFFMTKYVVVVGGVISGVGKGVTTAALGKIVKEHGYSTTLIKIDPYINVDAGTLRPTEHGEVWVTDDGGEIDQDLGTYERFLDQDIPKQNNITTGQIYKAVIDRERRGEYLGQTVQFIPHITNEIIARIKQAAQGYDIAIVEIGGIVGDYENKPFLFAVRALERQLGADHVAYILVTYLPIPSHIDEMKIRPARQSIRQLNEDGISPDFIICRSKYAIDEVRKQKIEMYANIASDHIIAAPDVDTIYRIPLDLEAENMGHKVFKKLGLTSKKQPDWSTWQRLVTAIKEPQERIHVAIVGKYFDSGDFSLTDSYLSIYQALMHAGAQCNTGVKISWIDAKRFETHPASLTELNAYDGVIIPGGFGKSGVEGKIAAIEYVRTHNIPYLGLCYGMQLAAVEYARNVCGLREAHTTEVDEHTQYPIVAILDDQKAVLDKQNYGGTMRLGSYDAMVQRGSRVHALYLAAQRVEAHGAVRERHRHRYEMNPQFVPVLESAGLHFSGYYERADGTRLMEFLEVPTHPFFVATQAHPEFKSRLGNPNPLFYGFVQACRQIKMQCAQGLSVQREHQL
jgi:CTP synthase